MRGNRKGSQSDTDPDSDSAAQRTLYLAAQINGWINQSKSISQNGRGCAGSRILGGWPDSRRPGTLLQVMVVRSDSQSANVNRNRNDDPGTVPRMLPGRAVMPARGTRCRQAIRPGSDTTAAQPRLHSFPLGSPILEPDFHLDLRQFQRVGDMRSLGEA